jgi:succinate dehydrogenase / fumarate reductase flavoprotein subunit
LFEAPAVVIATGGVGKTFKITSNSWEGTGDGHALALKAGANLVDMEFLQFHPTGMVWPPSVRGILVTESVRGEGGVLTNNLGERFMFKYIPDVFKDKYADNEAEADRWYEDQDNNRRPPELLPRDEVARAINSEVKAGRGTEHGGVFLDVSKRLPAELIKKRLPSMWHQFYELAGVDITKEAMEVGPTCHYVMGGVEVEPDTAAAVGVPGLFAAGEVAGGMHGSNRLGGNSLTDLLVFGRRAGVGAVDYVKKNGANPVSQAAITAAANKIQAPFDREGGENSYSLHAELQEITHNLVGIIRTGSELKEAITKIADIRKRSANVSVTGGRKFNPGFHLAFDLDNMLLVAESTAKSAINREESRGGHTRDDFPGMDNKWRQVNNISSFDGNQVNIREQALPVIPKELFDLFDIHELEKYMTPQEIAKGGSN